MAVESGPTLLGTPLPEATLPDLHGRPVALSDIADGHPLLVVFSCNHCPYVRWIERELAAIAAEYPDLRTVAICANDATEYPEDGPEGLRDQVSRAGWDFPYLIDQDQDVARGFGAVCTPDFFLFDASGLLCYRGALDASSPKNGQPLTGDLLRAAIGNVLAGRAVPGPHRPAMGCSIKWVSA
jgi:thiol-disulfide isomerase/thioredoxin